MEEAVISKTTTIQSWIEALQAEWLVVFLAFSSLLLLIILFVFTVAIIKKKIAAFKYRKAHDKAREVILQAEKLAKEIVVDASVHSEAEKTLFQEEYTNALLEDKQAIKNFLDSYRSNLEEAVTDVSHAVRERNHRAADDFDRSLDAIEEQVVKNANSAKHSLDSLEQQVAQNANNAKHNLDSLTAQSSSLIERLGHEMEGVEKGIDQLAVGLQQVAQNESNKNTEIIQSEMKRMKEETAQSIAAVSKEMNHTLHTAMEGELQAVAKELEHYRLSRKQLVDDHILTLVEETAQIALQKQLSVQDQAELVYRSLEEAKKRGVFS